MEVATVGRGDMPEIWTAHRLAAGSPGASPAARAPAPPFLVWRNEWTLGVDFMDQDHRLLAASLNQIAPHLLPSSDRRWPWSGAEQLLAGLDALAARTREHFRREEIVMRLSGYPGLAEHQAEHALLMAELTVMLRDVRNAGPAGMELGLFTALKQCLLGHMLDDDRALARYLCSLAASGHDLLGDAERLPPAAEPWMRVAASDAPSAAPSARIAPPRRD